MINEIEKDDGDNKSVESSDTQCNTMSHQVMIATESDSTEPAGVVLLLDEETYPSEDKVFYMDPGFSFQERSDLLELDLEEDNDMDYQPEEIMSENLDELKLNSKKLSQSELIDKFIIANPRIEPQKDKKYVSNEDISMPFVEETASLVTETLAKIYVNQGYYSKAIDIYE